MYTPPRTIACELEELAILKRVCDTQPHRVVGTDRWASESDTEWNSQTARARESRKRRPRTAAARSSRTCGVRHLPRPGRRRCFALFPEALCPRRTCQWGFGMPWARTLVLIQASTVINPDAQAVALCASPRWGALDVSSSCVPFMREEAAVINQSNAHLRN